MAPRKTPKPTWFRRIVPPGYQRATLTLTGTSPLLMNSGDVDRDGEEYRAYYLLGQKRGKSLDDDARLRELEWALAMYLDETVGPFIPGKNVKELLRSAATKFRKGEDIKRSLVVIDYRVPLLYDGPRDQASLWEQGYRYTTLAANGGVSRGRVWRCRPKFEDWALVAEIAYDPEDLDFDFLNIVVDRSRKFGLGDYRPEFGSFEAELIAGDVHKLASNGSALKAIVRESLRAHEAIVGRIVQEGAPA